MSDNWSRRKSRRTTRRSAVILAAHAVAFSAIALSGLAIAFYLLFPVQEVRVEGNEMVSRSAIMEGIPERTSLPMIWLRDLESGLDSNSWVKGVNVETDWESGMVLVEVEEREAVLNASLAGGGRVVLAEDGSELPGLGGASLERIEVDRVRLENIQAGQRVLEANDMEVESVQSVGARGVELKVRGPRESSARILFSGEITAGQVHVLEDLVSQRPDAPYFDLRTPERVLVGGGSGGVIPGGARGDATVRATG